MDPPDHPALCVWSVSRMVPTSSPSWSFPVWPFSWRWVAVLVTLAPWTRRHRPHGQPLRPPLPALPGPLLPPGSPVGRVIVCLSDRLKLRCSSIWKLGVVSVNIKKTIICCLSASMPVWPPHPPQCLPGYLHACVAVCLYTSLAACPYVNQYVCTYSRLSGLIDWLTEGL